MFSYFSVKFIELSNELMCSFELESIVKFLFPYCFVLNGLLENSRVHLFQFVYNFNEFSLSVSH